MNVEEFLLGTECHFNWNPSALNEEKNVDMVERFRSKLDENYITDEPSHLIWPLKLSYAYELFAMEKEESAKVVEEAIQEIEQAEEESLTCKYQTSYLHIAYSFKAFTLVKSNEENSINLTNLLERIKPFAEMTPVERSAVFAIQALVLRFYGPKGTIKGIPLLRESIRLNPEEIEFKIELVVSMHRKRHYDLNVRSNMTWSQYEEPVNILEHVLNHPGLTDRQRVTCEYFLAVIYYDYSFALSSESKWGEYSECKNQIIKSCNWMHDKTTSPSILAFCAEKIFILENDKPKGMRIIESALQRFPSCISTNTTASKLYRNQKDLRSAAKHAQIAMDGGGFGAAWILLQLKTELGEDFDDDEYFNNILSRFSQPAGRKKQIHLNASLYYFLKKHEAVKGARHMEMTVIEDPSYESLKRCYSHWVRGYIVPLEVAYGKIVEALRSAEHSKEDLEILSSAKHVIEEVATFDLTKCDKPEGGASRSNGRGKEPRRMIRGNYRAPRNFSQWSGAVKDSAPKEGNGSSKEFTVPTVDSGPREEASSWRAHKDDASTTTNDHYQAPRSDPDSGAAVDVLVPMMRDSGFNRKPTSSTTNHSVRKECATDWRNSQRTRDSDASASTNTRKGGYQEPMSDFNRDVAAHRRPLWMRGSITSKATTSTCSVRKENTTNWRKGSFP